MCDQVYEYDEVWGTQLSLKNMGNVLNVVDQLEQQVVEEYANVNSELIQQGTGRDFFEIICEHVHIFGIFPLQKLAPSS